MRTSPEPSTRTPIDVTAEVSARGKKRASPDASLGPEGVFSQARRRKTATPAGSHAAQASAPTLITMCVNTLVTSHNLPDYAEYSLDRYFPEAVKSAVLPPARIYVAKMEAASAVLLKDSLAVLADVKKRQSQDTSLERAGEEAILLAAWTGAQQEAPVQRYMHENLRITAEMGSIAQRRAIVVRHLQGLSKTAWTQKDWHEVNILGAELGLLCNEGQAHQDVVATLAVLRACCNKLEKKKRPFHEAIAKAAAHISSGMSGFEAFDAMAEEDVGAIIAGPNSVRRNPWTVS